MATTCFLRSPRSIPSVLRRTLVGAGLGLAALHGTAWATNDLTIVAGVCSPGSADTLEFGLTSKPGGYLRRGRNPPAHYFCPVWNPDFTTVPSWTKLQFQCLNPNTDGALVRARLYAKNRATGATQLVASISCPTSPFIQVASTNLKVPLDFAVNGYFGLIELHTTVTEVQAHAFMLSN